MIIRQSLILKVLFFYRKWMSEVRHYKKKHYRFIGLLLFLGFRWILESPCGVKNQNNTGYLNWLREKTVDGMGQVSHDPRSCLPGFSEHFRVIMSSSHPPPPPPECVASLRRRDFQELLSKVTEEDHYAASEGHHPADPGQKLRENRRKGVEEVKNQLIFNWFYEFLKG